MANVIRIGGGGAGGSTITLPPMVTNLKAVGSNATITVTFTNPVSDALAGVLVVYNSDHMPEKPSDGSKFDAGLTQQAVITGLTNGTQYYIRVFPYNEKKQYQTLIDGATTSATPNIGPAQVTNFQITGSGSSPVLSWTNPTDDPTYHETVVIQKVGSAPTSISDGTEIYRGTGETTTANGLEQLVNYYFGVFTVNAEGGTRGPVVSEVYNYTGTPITELPSGTKVKLGKWNNTDLQWKVARDTSDQSVRLVLEPTSVSLLGNKMWDNEEPSNSDRDRRRFGSNRYIYSNIHQWLNATKASNWYTAQHSTDAAPDYSSQAGFLSGWSENHIAALDRATLTVSRSNADGGGTETFVSRVALMSTTELGLESGTGNGRLDIFNSDGDRATGSVYRTRTPDPSSSSDVAQVYTNGTFDMYDIAVNAYGVRPLCSPKSTALVSMEMDGDNCYIVQ